MMNSSRKAELNILDILKHQRNRYPVLLIDKIVEFEPGLKVSGIKCFTYNEWFFPGHFDDEPNVPGFVQLESLVQAFILTFLCKDEYSGMKTNFVSINNVKFKRKIVPGDVLKINATLMSLRCRIAKGYAESNVEGEAACSADFVISLPEVLDNFKPK